MLISTKGRYALRVMIDLAEHQTEGYIPLKTIAQRQGISEKYLESIIKLLVKAQLLSGVRGKGRRLQTDENAGTVHRRADPAADGRISCPGSLSGTGRIGLFPCGGMPHAVSLAGAGSGHQQLSGRHYAGGSDAPGRRR